MRRDDIQFFKTRKLEELDFLSNSPPSVFIGSKLKYPNVNVGILSPSQPLKQVELLNNSNEWTSLNLSINQILGLRNQLINSRFSKELDRITKPISLSAPLKNIRITENTKIHTKVDKVVSDTDMKANEAINYMYNNGFDEGFLQQLLTIGSLGLKKNRKLVPTRWGITATDDILGKEIMKEIKNYEKINEHILFFDKYLGNYYFILLIPEIFSYELFEYGVMYGQIKGESTDFEDYFGRKNYASNSVGGYYSVRLSVLEYLRRIKRQAGAFIIRFETEEYWANLGVWVTRSCARRAMGNESVSFHSRESALDFMRNFILNKTRIDVGHVFKKSRLLNYVKEQKGLKEFL